MSLGNHTSFFFDRNLKTSPILATAIAYRASTIVTDNLKDYSSYAKDRIKVTKVPNVPQQQILL